MTNGPVPAKYVPRKEVYLLPQAVCFQRQSYLGSLEFVPRRPVFGTPSSLLRLSFVAVTHFPTSPYRPPPVHYTANTIVTPTAATPLHLPLPLPQVPLPLSQRPSLSSLSLLPLLLLLLKLLPRLAPVSPAHSCGSFGGHFTCVYPLLLPPPPL